MNLIDNGVKKFISVEKVDDGEHLGFKVIYIDWYNKKRFDYVNTLSAVNTYQECTAQWVE